MTLRNALQRSSRARRGFTLVEILIVVVILGVLAAIVVTSFGGVDLEARSSAAQSDLKHMQTQVMLEAQANGGGFPDEISNDMLTEWFGRVRPHPFSTGETPLGVETDESGDSSMTHPAEKLIAEDSFGWWYNPTNGVIRSRVPDQGADEVNLDLYRLVNITSIGNLADVE